MMVSDFATDATGNTDSVENWTQLRRLFSDSRHNGIVEAKAFQITSWTQRSKSYWIGGNRLTAVTTLCTISGCEERGTDWRWCPCVAIVTGSRIFPSSKLNRPGSLNCG